MAFTPPSVTTKPSSPRVIRPPLLDPSRISLTLSPDGIPEELGRGTFAVVYAATLDSTCPVAVKSFHPTPGPLSSTHPLRDATSQRGAIARRQFQREARRYVALQKVPGIAHFHGMACPTSNSNLFVTERMWGGSLREALAKGTLDSASLLRVAHKVALIVAELHRNGFTHGDLKAANVLFSQPLSNNTPALPESVKIKLVDFGLSRSFSSTVADSSDDEDHDVSFSSQTSAPARVEGDKTGDWFLEPLDTRGTPGFLSPEAWCGSKALRDRTVAEKADVYALVMLLYELETGMVPWNKLSEWGIFVAVCNQGARPAWPNRPEHVPGLRTVVEQSWVQDHRARPTAQQVADKIASLCRARKDGLRLGHATGVTNFSPVRGSRSKEEMDPRLTEGTEGQKGQKVDAEACRMRPTSGSPGVRGMDMELDGGSDNTTEGRQQAVIRTGQQSADANEVKLRPKGALQNTVLANRGERDGNALATIATRSATHAPTTSRPVVSNHGPVVMDVPHATRPALQQQPPIYRPVNQQHAQNTQIASRSASVMHPPQINKHDSTPTLPTHMPSVPLEHTTHVIPDAYPLQQSNTTVVHNDPGASSENEQSPQHIVLPSGTSEPLGDMPADPSQAVAGASIQELTGGHSKSAESANPPDQKHRLREDYGSDTTTDIAVPDSVRSLNYAFKTQVMSNDCATLCKALQENGRNPRNATRILEALCVLLENDRENCEFVVERRAMRLVTGIVSRYGSADSRLCKTACLIVYRMAACQSPKAEAELRTTGSCEIVLNSIQWHPANLPVIQNAACAINILCRVSPVLCSILLNLGGADCALRVLARGSKSFGRDVPVASAGLEVIGLIAKSPSGVDILAENDAVQKVLECCDLFEDERIDRHVLAILFSLTRHLSGQMKILLTPGGMAVIYRLIHRICAGDETSQKLKLICDVVSALADVPAMKQPLARGAFLSSYPGEAIVQGVQAFAEQSTGETNFSDAALMVSSFGCFRSMSTLGQDVCGALKMAKIFHATDVIIRRFTTDRRIAVEALVFLNTILRGLHGLSLGADFHIVAGILDQLQSRWHGDSQIRAYITGAKQLMDISTGNENQVLESQSTPESSDSKQQPRSVFRLFRMKRSMKDR